MEMPIQVMVTLFVALAVAVFVIMFARNVLSEAEKITVIKDPNAEDRLVYANKITLARIADYVVRCYNKNYGRSFQDNFCTAITVNVPVSISKSALAQYVDLNDNAYVVDDTTTKSVAIFWNSKEGIVEVRG